MTQTSTEKTEKKEKAGKEEQPIEGPPDVMGGQDCPMCNTKNLTLTEASRDIPYFGKVYLYCMDCSNCHFHKSDVETEKAGEPTKITFEVASEADMKVRVIKSAEATVKIPRITTIEPGAAANGYVTNIEGLFNRVKHQIEVLRDTSEEDEDRNKAKSLLKKIRGIMWGEEKIVITIEDPTGNSAIISDKAVVTKGKASK
jgi:zinc finger protein